MAGVISRLFTLETCSTDTRAISESPSTAATISSPVSAALSAPVASSYVLAIVPPVASTTTRGGSCPNSWAPMIRVRAQPSVVRVIRRRIMKGLPSHWAYPTSQ